jgi:hypothetical protein
MVQDLSVSGLGLIPNSNVSWPPPGSVLEGKLYIDDIPYEISLYMVYNNETGIGTQIVEYDKRLETALRKYALSQESSEGPEG